MEFRQLFKLEQVLLDVQLHLFVLRFIFFYLADPGVVEELSDRRPGVLVPVQAQPYKVLGVLRNVGPLAIRELEIFGLDIQIDFFDVLAVEGSLPREQLVRDNAQAPHVDLLAILLVLN